MHKAVKAERKVVRHGHEGGHGPASLQQRARARAFAGLRNRVKPSVLYVVGIVFLALAVAGCEVHIEAGDGSMVVVADRLPHNVVDVWYEAKSDAGFGHYVRQPMTMAGHSAYVERDPAASGTWTVKVFGYDRVGGQREVVFEREQTVVVSSKKQTLVTFEIQSFDRESSHGLFVAHDLSRALLDRYIDEFQRYIVPGLSYATTLQAEGFKDRSASFEAPETSAVRPFIHLYGTTSAWQDSSPCSEKAARCHDIESNHIHVNAASGDGFNPKTLTEAYVLWLVERIGGKAVPFWLAAGLARNEAERIQRGESHWRNPWVQQQWDDIRATRAFVPNLTSQSEANAFTYTAVAHLLQDRGGSPSLHTLFRQLVGGVTFHEAFLEAFGTTPFGYELQYENVVLRERM